MVFESEPGHIRHYASFLKPIDVPTSKLDDFPYICLLINEQWLPFVLGAVDVLRHRDLYAGDEEHIDAALQEVERLFLALMSGNILCPEDVMIELRQNPADPCQLQISYDNGETWELAFDYSLCMQSEDDTFIDVDVVSNWNDQSVTNFTTYNEDITNVYPGWAYGDADDTYRDDVLCWAAGAWVLMVCDLCIAALYDQLDTDKNKLQRAAEAFGVVGGLAASLVSFGVFPVTLAIGALTMQIAGSLLDLYSEMMVVDPSVYLDEEARSIVRCLIYDAMKGDDPNFNTWTGCLVNHGLTGNAGHIATACRIMMAREETFVEYFIIVGDMIQISKLGADLACPCEEKVTHWFKFSIPEGSAPHTDYDNDEGFTSGQGTFVSESGWEHEDAWHFDAYKRRVSCEVDCASTTLTRIRVNFDYIQDPNHPLKWWGKTAFAVYVEYDGGDETVFKRSFAQTWGRDNWECKGRWTGVTHFRVWLASSYRDWEHYDGEATITEVVVDMEGDDVFD